jgi:septal ring factor EnvC (AmiA/AmiB activator)
MSAKSLICGACFVAMAAGPLAWAEGGEASALQSVEQDLVLSKQRQVELQARAKDAVVAQDQLSDQLVALAETALVQERAVGKIDKRLVKLKTDIAERNVDLAAQQDVTALVLAGLQRLEHNPPPALVVAPDDVLTALRSAMMFGAVLPELKQQALKLQDTLSELTTLRDELTQQQDSHAQAKQALAQSRDAIKKLIVEKQQLAADATRDLAEEKNHSEDLAAKATSLKQLLASLEAERKQSEAQASTETKALLEAERQLKAQQLLPQMAFSKVLGQLHFPAQGQFQKAYGSETGFGSTLDGIVIATEKQAQVVAPVGGVIEFAGKFRSYGQMVIINPGEGYLVLLAGLNQVGAIHGQSVKAGEPLGEMGDKPSKMALTGGLTKDLTNATTPMLYVEFRLNGDPVDPAPWWIGNRQEATR